MCETERQAEMELIEFLKFTEQDDCDKYNMLQQSACEIRGLENKNQRLKEVIEEVWNFIKKYPGISQSGVMTIKQILDKVKEN